MANSGTVAAGDTATATQYNNLRKDVLDVTTGHTHSGTDSAKLSPEVTFGSAATRYYRVTVFDVVHETPGTSFSMSVSMGLRCLNTNENRFLFPVHLPHGATVTSFKVFWSRDDASAVGEAYLFMDTTAMATAHSNATSGAHTVEDTSISEATIDNTAHNYFGFLKLDPNDNTADVAFMGAVITYTVLAPLP